MSSEVQNPNTPDSQITDSQSQTTDSQATDSEIGEVVRNRRRALRLRQEELADLSGVSIRFIHSVEHGKPGIRLDKLQAILEVLGLAIRIERA